MLILKVAFRNILRQKRRTVLTVLTMFGGFTLAAISISWSDGTYSYIIDMFTRNKLGHIQVHKKGYMDKPSLYNTVREYEEIGKRIAEIKGVVSWAPRIYAAGLAAVKEKSAGVQIIGIDPEREETTTRFSKKIVEGREFSKKYPYGVLLGKGLAGILKAGVEDEIALISQGADGSMANDLYLVKGIIDSGDPVSDRMSLYLHIEDAQEFLVLYGCAHEIAITVDDLRSVGRLTEEIKITLDDEKLSVEPWQEFAKEFYNAMKADQKGMWITLLIIILIVSVGVFNTVLMSVLERRREYGLLKALGTKPYQVAQLIIYEVCIMVIISFSIGIPVGLLVNYLLSLRGIPLPEAFTYGGVQFSRMYTEINMRSFYIPGITIIVSAIVIALFPAISAMRTDPAKTMRMH